MCASTEVFARSRVVGRGRYLVNGPAPIAGACAVRVRRRSGDLPGLRCTRAPGRWDLAVIGPTLTVAASQATTAPPARHSTRVTSTNESRLWKLCTVGAVHLSGLWRSSGSPPSQGAAEKVLVWPVTL